MALLFWCDPALHNTSWGDAKLRGMQDEVMRRREKLETFTDFNAFEAAASKLDKTSSGILLIDDIKRLQKLSVPLSDLPIHLILSTYPLTVTLPFTYSIVGTDVYDATSRIIDYLHLCGKKRIAMVAVNLNSLSDTCRAETMKRYLPENELKIFYAVDDMLYCFSQFLSEYENYDAVICPNDHVAICLIEFLKAHSVYKPDLFVIGHGDTVMARLYKGGGITSVTTHHYTCGKAAVETHFNRLKYGWSTVNILLKAELKIRGSTGNIPYLPSKIKPHPLDLSPLLNVPLLRIPTNPIGRIEQVLAVSDLVNLKIIYCMMCKFSYEQMSEFCFLSVETAKYRVRKIRDMLHSKNKADAADLIRTYVEKDSLLCVIEELQISNDQTHAITVCRRPNPNKNTSALS